MPNFGSLLDIACNNDVVNYTLNLFLVRLSLKPLAQLLRIPSAHFSARLSLRRRVPPLQRFAFMLPYKFNWKTSTQTVTDVRKEPHSNLYRGPDFPVFRGIFFSFSTVPLEKFCREMHQTNPAALNINSRHDSFKLKFIMVFTHAFHWSLFSRISIQITPHFSMTCVSILSWNLSPSLSLEF